MLYKYLASDYFPKVFPNRPFVRLKASHPQDFNDPYELFLTINTVGLNADILAYYQEIVGMVAQWPTVCFSARPDVIPMWAHYAREFSGIVIECEKDNILKAFPEGRIEDVDYRNTPAAINADQLAYAYETSKPRHTLRLQHAAFNAAYFTKSAYWSYEMERRLVINDEAVTILGGLMTIQFPLNCVSAIISGPKTRPDVVLAIDKYCKKRGYAHYRMHIGRSSMRPFFVDAENRTCVFGGEVLMQTANCCVVCSEPLEHDAGEQCHWCIVSDAGKKNAALRNPLRRLAGLGLLEDYVKRVSSIGRGLRCDS